MKLFVLAVSVWDANDWLNQRNTNPRYVDVYLYDSEKKAKEKAKNVDVDSDIYNDGTIYVGELTTKQIKEIAGCTMKEFKKMLKEPYSTTNRCKNWGEDEKGDVASEILRYPDNEYPVYCPNYDFDKTLEGCVLVCWSWQKYIGYARKCIEVRYADDSDTEALLTKEDKTFVAQWDVLLTAEEVSEATNIQDAIREALQDGDWRWTNPQFAENQAENF